jgi:hypothetical protein
LGKWASLSKLSEEWATGAKKMRIKLYWKLTFIFCLAFILAITAGYLYLIFHLKSYVETSVANNIKHQLSLSREFLEGSYDRTIPTDYQDAALKIGKALGLRATIIT